MRLTMGAKGQHLIDYSPSGLTARKGAAKMLEVLSAFEPGVRSAKLSIDDTFTNSFVEQAEKKYP
jgi:hypothetical protein